MLSTPPSREIRIQRKKGVGGGMRSEAGRVKRLEKGRNTEAYIQTSDLGEGNGS